MNERKLERGSRINTADEGTLERPIASNIFERLNDSLVGKPIAKRGGAIGGVCPGDRYREGLRYLRRRLR